MKIPRLIRRILWSLFALLLVLAIGLGGLWLYLHPRVQLVRHLVYGQRHGQDLTLDVARPAHPNGAGLIVMMSGGWKSSAGSFQPWIAAPLLRRGYTLFAVYHVSQPKATIMEIVEDAHRAVRYVRQHAAEHGIDPQRLGVTGGSAGGHLSLMVATRGGPGPASAPDPLERQSSAVQAVAIFYPPTDLLNLGPSTENLGDGGPPKSFVKGFGPQATNLAVWKVIGRDTSPIYFVHSNLPPTLIYHGDADTLVPLEQSQRYLAAAQRLGCRVELVVHHGGRHGWPTMLWDTRRFADWFDQYLAAGTSVLPSTKR